MKKRVTIITWMGDTTLNYGATLQATAMQELLKNQNCIPTTMKFMYLGKTAKERMMTLMSRGSGYAKTYFRFKKWIKKYINVSPQCYFDDDVVAYAKENSDILLCGSDCIWGDAYNTRQLFFWDYEELDGLPHIAYASGLDKGEITYDMSRVIDKFVAISGREKYVSQILSKYNKPIATVLDPTLTVSESFWEKRAGKRMISGDYIVCYILSRIECHQVSIEKIKKKYNVNHVVCIDTNFIDKPCNEVYSDYNGNVSKKTVGPKEFLSLIKYAKVVCTDSFHGMCFSLVFRREFYIFSLKRIYTMGEDRRFASLLPKLGLTQRYILLNSDIDKVEDINWTEVETNLYKERQESIQFLKDAIDKCDAYKEPKDANQ